MKQTHHKIFGPTIGQNEVAFGQNKDDEYIIPPSERLRAVDYRNARRSSRICAVIGICFVVFGIISHETSYGNQTLFLAGATLFLIVSLVMNLFSLKNGKRPRSIRVMENYYHKHFHHH